jgi:GSH-dependent disulfide-bond oxidoreductase
MYLAEKTGKFLPKDTAGRFKVIEWLMWQMAGLGPMTGQLGYYNVFTPEPVPAAWARYHKEVTRLLGVLDKRLSEADYVAGEFSIADMAIYPWLENLGDFYRLPEMFEPFDRIKDYRQRIAARPGTQRGMVWPRA